MKKKGDEIEIKKKRITSLETLNELLQIENADLTNISHKQKQLEKKVSNAITLCKDLKQKTVIPPSTEESSHHWFQLKVPLNPHQPWN